MKNALKGGNEIAQGLPASKRNEFTAKLIRYMEAADKLEKLEEKWKNAKGGFNVKTRDATGTLEKGKAAIENYEKSKSELASYIKNSQNQEQLIEWGMNALKSFSSKLDDKATKYDATTCGLLLSTFVVGIVSVATNSVPLRVFGVVPLAFATAIAIFMFVKQLKASKKVEEAAKKLKEFSST